MAEGTKNVDVECNEQLQWQKDLVTFNPPHWQAYAAWQSFCLWIPLPLWISGT